MSFRLAVAAGGTGGHFYPGVAVLEALRATGDVEALFVGTERGIEAKKVPAMGERLLALDVAPLNGVSALAKFKSLSRLPRAVFAASRALKSFAPHALLSVGGYASGPATLAAIARGIPVVVVEPNAIAGMTNRIVGRWVHRACVSFDETRRYFRSDAVRVTGSPVRQAFLERAERAAFLHTESHADGAEFQLLVLGGSQGARALNDAVPDAIAALKTRGLAVRVLHQTGERDLETVRARYSAMGLDGEAETTAFVDDVASAMAQADLVICRGGAGTVSELCVMGRAALYVPLPSAADDHQRKNAEAIAARGAGECLLQRDLTAISLADRVEYHFARRDELRAMHARARELGRPHAAHDVAVELRALARKS
ncbi:MAG: undecaprenyldiphospho-muramoylpentapeptide beta-N-acetylglucosaminyltransferase [Deltaproteobacteria bacterium]|nr:undecaprenyldiphospho-muramoylpentapeptide beta-N-acetylglucosaminyltransferase [Deltaproteobacteria bacterium]